MITNAARERLRALNAICAAATDLLLRYRSLGWGPISPDVTTPADQELDALLRRYHALSLPEYPVRARGAKSDAGIPARRVVAQTAGTPVASARLTRVRRRARRRI